MNWFIRIRKSCLSELRSICLKFYETALKQLSPLVEEASEEFKDKIKVCKMDVDVNRETAAEYGIRSIPTLMIFENGNPVAREIGALTKLQLDEFIRSKI